MVNFFFFFFFFFFCSVIFAVPEQHCRTQVNPAYVNHMIKATEKETSLISTSYSQQLGIWSNYLPSYRYSVADLEKLKGSFNYSAHLRAENFCPTMPTFCLYISDEDGKLQLAS